MYWYQLQRRLFTCYRCAVTPNVNWLCFLLLPHIESVRLTKRRLALIVTGESIRHWQLAIFKNASTKGADAINDIDVSVNRFTYSCMTQKVFQALYNHSFETLHKQSRLCIPHFYFPPHPPLYCSGQEPKTEALH